MRPLLRGLLPLLILALAGCGNGTLADIWDSFPEEAFNPPDDGGDGGGGGGGGGITLEEIRALAGGQGVTGTVKNIALAAVGSKTYAFLAAGTDGCHVVDVTAPELVSATSYVTTIRPGVLATAELAGGRVDAIAAVDNAYLVCVAVDATATMNCVTVFNLPLLIVAATSPAADLSGAVIPPTTPGTDAIVVTGDAGKGGAVAATGPTFFVATGAAELAAATVAGTPPTWTVDAPVSLGIPVFTTVTDVAVSAVGGVTGVFASGRRADGEFAVATTTPGAPVATSTAVDTEAQRVVDDFVATEGNYPLDLWFDALTLYVTGNNALFVYSVSPTTGGLALVSTVPNTGSKTIAAAASSGTFVVGAGDSVRVGTNVLGQARVTGSLTFPGTFTIRGVAVRSTAEGVFFLVCAGTGGLRILQVPSAPGP